MQVSLRPLVCIDIVFPMVPVVFDAASVFTFNVNCKDSCKMFYRHKMIPTFYGLLVVNRKRKSSLLLLMQYSSSLHLYVFEVRFCLSASVLH